MEKKSVLETLQLGDGIAEYDDNLSDYFIDTVYVSDFVKNKYDIILGEKGSGKSAMMIGVFRNPSRYSELADVQMVIASNLTGDPDFKRAFASMGEDMTETELIDAWKIYIFNLLWKQYMVLFSENVGLKKYLENKRIIETEEGFFAKLIHSIKRAKVNKITVYNKTQIDGTNEMGGSVDFDNAVASVKDETIDFNFIFSELDKALEESGSNIWILLDRLDDAFPDKAPKSIEILKALFYAYKDICAHKRFKVKIFIREDIFSDVTKKGFTSLTHITSKTMNPIKWDREKIIDMFITRLVYNECFREYISRRGIDYENIDLEVRREILESILKKQIDVGQNNPDTIGWILNHIKDGKGRYTPRDFILLIDKARAYQLGEGEERRGGGDYLIGAAAIRKAYYTVSELKLSTQLYAEYPEYRNWIEKFKNGKSTHNEETIKKILGSQWKSRVEKLVYVGFLEEIKGGWNIPFIYRPALQIVQGKAYK